MTWSEDFTRGEDRIDLTAFHTSLAELTEWERHGHNAHGFGDDNPAVTLRTEGHDSVLAFAGGSVRIEGYRAPGRARLHLLSGCGRLWH